MFDEGLPGIQQVRHDIFLNNSRLDFRTAVSYTHLDVYKRQRYTNLNEMTSPNKRIQYNYGKLCKQLLIIKIDVIKGNTPNQFQKRTTKDYY